MVTWAILADARSLCSDAAEAASCDQDPLCKTTANAFCAGETLSTRERDKVQVRSAQLTCGGLVESGRKYVNSSRRSL